MRFNGVYEFNAYLGIIDGLNGTYNKFIDLSYNEPILPLNTFIEGNEAYLTGYLLGLEIINSAKKDKKRGIK